LINFSGVVAEVTLGMRESDSDWPAAVAPDARASRTGGSRMLLDELLAKRERVETPAHEPAPHAPVLTIEPVAVPPTGEIGRRAARQRLAALEDAARRNLRAAEEARRVLVDEHRRLQEESSARVAAQDEAAALRRELGRLRESEQGRADQLKTYAARAARAELAAEHDRVVEELSRLQGSIQDHDGLLDDYAERLREEQATRAALQAELQESETARRLAERSLEWAVESARKHAEDEVIRLATAEAALTDAQDDRDRLAAHLGARIEDMQAELMQAREATGRLADLEGALAQSRADGERLRAHAAALGDELAALRATVAEMKAAVTDPVSDARPSEPSRSSPIPVDAAPARPPLARRRPRAEREAEGEASPRREGIARRFRTHDVPAPAPAPAREPGAAEAAASGETDGAPGEADAHAGAAVPPGFRRTAMAELTAIASASEADDFTFRRQ